MLEQLVSIRTNFNAVHDRKSFRYFYFVVIYCLILPKNLIHRGQNRLYLRVELEMQRANLDGLTSTGSEMLVIRSRNEAGLFQGAVQSAVYFRLATL